MSRDSTIIELALAARTVEKAKIVQTMIAKSIGGQHQRPLGDRWSNLGLLTRVGDTDPKLLEPVTNSQDSVLELLALQRFGSIEAVPYNTPHEAATALLGHMRWQRAAESVTVELHESNPPARKTGRLTPIFKDTGCGMTPAYIPKSIFYLGTRHKGKADWQQGAFGLGGASTFRHAEAVVLVTRRHPDLLGPGEEDRIAVAVCLWEELDKGSGLYYLTTTDWADGDNPVAEPWSALASEYPELPPGTHLALISYEPERIHNAAWGGEFSFERMLNTRLFEPVIPVRIDNRISPKAHPQNYRGLKRQFEENPRNDRKETTETMPFMLDGMTYHLPVSAYYFEAGPRADVGGKRNFVNPEHALMFVSNGQCHQHWKPIDLRHKTELTHIYDRLVIVIELDELPIRARTHLFPPERQGFVDRPDTRRLEQQVAEFLNDWDQLVDYDRDVLRRAIAGERNGRPTINIARQIGRALKFKGGFRLTGTNGNGRGQKRRKKLAKADLYPDPTTIEGQAKLKIEQGATRFVRYHVNATDNFVASRRGQLRVSCDHPDITTREITVGPLHKGFIRVAIAVPAAAALGNYQLTAKIAGWERAGGGMGPDLVWPTEMTVIEPVPEDERRKRQRQAGDQRAEAGAGDLVGIVWRSIDDFPEEWHGGMPGHVDEIEASELAEADDDYKEVAKLGTAKIPTIFLNRGYTPLKRYEAARAHELSQRGLDEARDRYAVGTGLGLLLLDRDLKAKAASNGGPVLPEVELAAKQAVAQSTLVMMPQYDRLAKEAGVED